MVHLNDTGLKNRDFMVFGIFSCFPVNVSCYGFPHKVAQ